MRIAIIGNGAAAISGIEAFRKYDSKNPITLVSPEKSPPYSRVLLPYLLQGRIEHKDIYYRSPRLYDQLNIQTFLGHSVVEVDAIHKRLHLDSGERIPFDKLLIASGSSPVKPPIPGSNGSDIGHLWTIGDAIRIEKEFREKKRLLIIGGGFISLMLAWVAHERGIEVTIIELMPHVMPQTLDQKAAEILETEIQKTGTRLLTGTVVERIEMRPEGTYRICPAIQPSFPVDMVIVAAGARSTVCFAT